MNDLRPRSFPGPFYYAIICFMKRNYIVLDLEWNQGYPGQENPDIPFEVIEIGAVKLDSEKRIVDRFEELVRPKVYKKIYFMTAKVTDITMEELSGADTFPGVFRRFLRWCGEDHIFCTWGSMDLTELRRNMSFYHLNSSIKGACSYLDIQKLYSLEYDDGKSRTSLEKAVDMLGLRKQEHFHRAGSDALYTAEVFQELKLRELEAYESIDVYELPEGREDEVHVTFPTYSKYISRGFTDKTGVLNDKEARSLRCFYCDQKTDRYISWVTVNGKQYYSLGKCPEHGTMRGHLRIRKSTDGRVYAMKTIRPAKPGDEGDIRQKEKAMKVQEQKMKKMLRNQSHRTPKNTGGSSF